MGQKKSKKVLVVLISLVIILILLVGVAYCYLVTDLLKSNKQLFFKYVGQIVDSESGFLDSSLQQYSEKRKNTPYTNNGEFSLNISSEGETLDEYNNVNNFNISFSGQVDNPGNKIVQDISLNYSDKVNFPISYKKIENIVGLQTKYVSKKYIAVETDNLDSLKQSADTTINLADTTQKIENLTQSIFSEEDWKHIKDTYLKVLNTQLQKTHFTKIEETNYIGYSLKLTGEELKNIYKQLLETLKNDQITLDKINEYLETQGNSTEITAEIIDDYIKELEENEELNDENLTITVYEQNNETKKIDLQTNEFKAQVEKVKENDSLKYIIFLEIFGEDEGKTTITLTANYTGLSTMQNIDESYEVEIKLINEAQSNNSIKLKYQLNNSIVFVNQVNIEEFSDENAMILTNYDTETIDNFLTSVFDRIGQVNKQQMEQLGLEETANPLLQLILPISNTGNITNATTNDMDIDALEISTFNEKFQMYEGTNIKGTTVKGLLTTIARNNGIDDENDLLAEESKPNHLITEINFNGEEYEVNEQNITFIKNEVKLDGLYRVEFEMEEDTGVIYRAVINEKVGE